MHVFVACLAVLIVLLVLVYVFGPMGGLEGWRKRKALRREAVTSLGPTDAAIARYEGQLHTDPDSVAAIHGLADAHWQKAIATQRRADWVSAEASLRRAVSVGPADARRLFGLGTCQWSLGHRREAVSSLRAVSELAPDDLEIHGQLDTMLFRSGNWRAFAGSVWQGARLAYQQGLQRRQ